MSPLELKAYQRGVRQVMAIAESTAARLEVSGMSILRRELAVQTMRALVMAAQELLATTGVEPEGETKRD